MEFKTLYQELVNSTEIITALLADISQNEARIKPNPESWSVLEVVCHLYDEEREDFREHLDFILHRQNDTWHQIDPEGWVTERNYNSRSFAEMQEKFLAERRKSLDWLQENSGANWETTYTSQFGSMKAGDMFASWIAHDNLHIRQLVELGRHRTERITKPYDIHYAGDW
jgi:uncharacterized damage-inducible protein DinB